MKIILISLFTACLAAVGTWFAKPTVTNESKTPYILTTKVFDGFEGTKDKFKTIKSIQEYQKKALDSMALAIQVLETKMGISHPGVLKHKENYERIYSEIVESNQTQVAEAQTKLWKQIDQYLSEYGKQNGYSYIYGASGDGNIMFADSTLNISEDVLVFINKKYRDE